MNLLKLYTNTGAKKLTNFMVLKLTSTFSSNNDSTVNKKFCK